MFPKSVRIVVLCIKNKKMKQKEKNKNIQDDLCLTTKEFE